jgi:hypothetical protein
VIPNTTNVIEEISRQSLEVASLIHEYTKLPRAGKSIPLLDPVRSHDGLFVARIVKNQIPGGLKSRIDVCRKSCAALKNGFYSRLRLDTNIQAKKNGTFLPARRCPSFDLTLAAIRTEVGGNRERPARYFRVYFLFDNQQ